MVGLFINTLPVRVAPAPARSRSAPGCAALQERQAEVRQYEYTPLAQVQRWSELPPGPPLFESLLVFENYPGRRAPGDGRRRGSRLGERERPRAHPLPAHRGPFRPATSLAVALGRDRRRFAAAAVGRLLRHFRLAALGAVACRPRDGRQLAALPLLTAPRRPRSSPPVEWNATAPGGEARPP